MYILKAEILHLNLDLKKSCVNQNILKSLLLLMVLRLYVNFLWFSFASDIQQETSNTAG